MIAWLRIAVGVVVLVAVTLVLLPVQLVGLRFNLRVCRRIPRLWHRVACRVLGIRVRVHGALEQQRPLLIAANHASWKDIMVLGSIADASGRRKPWIGALAVIQIVSVWMLWYAAPGTSLLVPLTLIVLATVAAEFSIVFNDSMMPSLVPPKEAGRVSNLAWGLGYLGGMVLLIAVVLFFAANPETGLTPLGIAPLFGLNAAMGEDARITGPISAVWYLVFILPMFLFTPDRGRGLSIGRAVRAGHGGNGSAIRSPSMRC